MVNSPKRRSRKRYRKMSPRHNKIPNRSIKKSRTMSPKRKIPNRSIKRPHNMSPKRKIPNRSIKRSSKMSPKRKIPNRSIKRSSKMSPKRKIPNRSIRSPRNMSPKSKIPNRLSRSIRRPLNISHRRIFSNKHSRSQNILKGGTRFDKRCDRCGLEMLDKHGIMFNRQWVHNPIYPDQAKICHDQVNRNIKNEREQRRVEENRLRKAKEETAIKNSEWVKLGYYDIQYTNLNNWKKELERESKNLDDLNKKLKKIEDRQEVQHLTTDDRKNLEKSNTKLRKIIEDKITEIKNIIKDINEREIKIRDETNAEIQKLEYKLTLLLSAKQIQEIKTQLSSLSKMKEYYETKIDQDTDQLGRLASVENEEISDRTRRMINRSNVKANIERAEKVRDTLDTIYDSYFDKYPPNPLDEADEANFFNFSRKADLTDSQRKQIRKDLVCRKSFKDFFNNDHTKKRHTSIYKTYNIWSRHIISYSADSINRKIIDHHDPTKNSIEIHCTTFRPENAPDSKAWWGHATLKIYRDDVFNPEIYHYGVRINQSNKIVPGRVFWQESPLSRILTLGTDKISLTDVNELKFLFPEHNDALLLLQQYYDWCIINCLTKSPERGGDTYKDLTEWH